MASADEGTWWSAAGVLQWLPLSAPQGRLVRKQEWTKRVVETSHAFVKKSLFIRRLRRLRHSGNPDRIGPGWITHEACDDMHMQLGHLIAQRGDIHLVGLEGLLHQARGAGDLLDQQSALGSRQIMDLPQIGARGHQDQPGKAPVIHQQQAAERPVAERNAVGGKARMEGEAIRHGASLASASAALQP